MFPSQPSLNPAPLAFGAEHVAYCTVKNSFLTLRQVSINFCDCEEKLMTWYPFD